MRISISASLVALAITGAVAQSAFSSPEHAVGGRTRKSLGFGPELPHAVFNTSPVQPLELSAAGRDSPFETAEAFVNHVLRRDGQLSESSHYELRDDSYTDDKTGVTHVYFRQRINGLEVADGLINVNVKDGVIISYGDSFYRGSVPAPFTSPASDQHLTTPWESNCQQLGLTMNQVFREDLRAMSGANGQVHMSEISQMSELAQRLERLYATNCGTVRLASERVASLLVDKPDDLASARDAVLTFMLAATPDENLQEDILSRYGEYLDRISSTFDTHLLPDGSARSIEMLSNVPDTVNPVKVYPAYAQVPEGDRTVLALVWKIEAEMQDNWYEAAVSMHRPHKIVSVVDWAADAAVDPMQLAPIPKKPKHEERAEFATYHVFPWGVNDPECGNRSFVEEGSDKLASPLGWHSIPAVNDPKSAGRAVSKDQINNYTTTWGNNVFAHENWEGRNNWADNYRPDAGASLVFNYTYNPKERDSSESLAEAKKYINHTVTQLFYTTNVVHDLFYRYGFDEKAGNFQQDNFGRGGREGDAVIANAQDGSGYNNANFMTPPDGQNGRCRMYIWNTAQPYRDGDLEAGIVIHELSHGLSIRLTGGPANSGCLGWGESGGMGEGWGDLFATLIRSTSTYSDYPMGAWAANRPGGIRSYPYSLNKTLNPVSYKTLDKPGYWEVHSIGAVWAEFLWVVAQKFIDKHGFSDSLFPPPPLEDGTIPTGDFYRPAEFDAQGKQKPLVPKHGNSLITQLVINGMKLQKCMPGFLDARDAIIQADQVLTGGENYCLLWEGFADRGLGPNARVDGRTPWGGGIRTDDFDVPDVCNKEKAPDDPDGGDDDGDDDDDDDDDEDWVDRTWSSDDLLL